MNGAVTPEEFDYFHEMIVTLERNGFIRRQPGGPRSIVILVPPETLPILEWLGIKTSKSL